MNQFESAALGPPEAASLLQLLKPFTVIPDSDEDYSSARTRFFVYDWLRKVVRKANKPVLIACQCKKATVYAVALKTNRPTFAVGGHSGLVPVSTGVGPSLNYAHAEAGERIPQHRRDEPRGMSRMFSASWDLLHFV